MFFLHQVAWVSASSAIFLFLPDLRLLFGAVVGTQVNWDRSLCILRDLREKLESGYFPSQQEWMSIGAIEAPWGGLALESITDLKENGIPVVPTLKRLEKALSDQKQADQEARAKCAQAWGQAVVCGSIVPFIAVALYFLVPGLREVGWKWWCLSLAALFLDVLAMAWMLSLSEKARWAGLRADRRGWCSAAFCFGERLLGSLRSGLPGDLAWSRALPQLHRQANELVAYWGADLWSDPIVIHGRAEAAARIIANSGTLLRKAIQTSIYEGRGCAERIEATLNSMRVELDCEVQRQIQLLSNQALKPLFFCVAPSALILLVLAFVMTWDHWYLS